MEDSAHINRLILRYKGGSAAAVRLAVERILGNSNLNSHSLPPSAILIIRHLQDPLPGKCTKSLSANWVNQEWERRVRGQITEFYRHASCPAHGPVPHSAQSVLFMDEGELLGCLALDIRRGLASRRWWWQSILRTVYNRKSAFTGHEAGAVLFHRMLRRPQDAVAAINWLEGRGLANDVLLILTPVQARQVLNAILDAYQLDGFQFQSAQAPGPPDSLTVVRPPWKTLEISTGLGRERAVLLGLSIDLKTRPETMRTHNYQHRVNSWWRAAEFWDRVPKWKEDITSGKVTTSAIPHGRKYDPLPEARPAGQLSVLSPKSIGAEWDAAGFQGSGSGKIGGVQAGESKVQGLSSSSLKNAESSVIPWSLQREPRTEIPMPAFSSEKVGERIHEHEKVGIRKMHHLSPLSDLVLDAVKEALKNPQDPRDLSGIPTQLTDVPHEQAESTTEKIFPTGMSTELGGVLYLINMMAVLEVPGCFEAGWRLASMVGAWGTLDALARELLGDELTRLQDDPLWTALSDLDGRPAGHLPGFRLPRSKPQRRPPFELPQDWLKGLPDLELVPISSFRLRKIHTTYPPLLAGWLWRVLPFIEARLRLALRLTPEETISQNLLLVPGRFYLTPSNFDLVASVEVISLAVRKTGLDCDPGWVPEFGRFIHFHYE